MKRSEMVEKLDEDACSWTDGSYIDIEGILDRIEELGMLPPEKKCEIFSHAFTNEWEEE